MAKQKEIYIYKNSSGQEICRVDLEDKKRPVKFSKHFKSLRNAGYEKLKVPVEEKIEKDNNVR